MDKEIQITINKADISPKHWLYLLHASSWHTIISKSIDCITILTWESNLHFVEEMYTYNKNASVLIKKHERAVEILEAIQSFEKRIELNKESINGFPGTFPQLRQKYENRIDTIQRCIKRLYRMYNSLMNEI